MTWAILGAAFLLTGFLWWRFTSVERGARKRDEQILRLIDRIGVKVEQGEPIDPAEIEDLASMAHVRPHLYAMLGFFDRRELFPTQYLTTKAQAESFLAYWLHHPNELNALPERVELIETMEKEIHGRRAEFLALRFLTKGVWLLGLSGPFFEGATPYDTETAAFSRLDKDGEADPKELVDWYVDLVKKKTRG